MTSRSLGISEQSSIKAEYVKLEVQGSQRCRRLRSTKVCLQDPLHVHARLRYRFRIHGGSRSSLFQQISREASGNTENVIDVIF